MNETQQQHAEIKLKIPNTNKTPYTADIYNLITSIQWFANKQNTYEETHVTLFKPFKALLQKEKKRKN